jgi:hypothetical protein
LGHTKNYKIKAIFGGEVSSINACYNSTVPWSFHGSAIPVWSSGTAITISSMMERSWDNTVDMITSNSSTISLISSGANGLLSSSNLSGTITSTTGSTLVTGTGTTFTTTFQVGDVISVNNGAQSRVITSITSNTQLNTLSAFSSNYTGASYSRGGAAPSAMHNLYAISYPNGSNPAFALSCRSVATGDTLVDLPAGYTKYRQLPISFPTTSTGNFFQFIVQSWPFSPTFMYIGLTSSTGAGSALFLFQGSVPTAATSINCQYLMPKISSSILVSLLINSASDESYTLGDPNITYSNFPTQGATYSVSSNLQCFSSNLSRTIQHSASSSFSLTLSAVGYVVTEMI